MSTSTGTTDHPPPGALARLEPPRVSPLSLATAAQLTRKQRVAYERLCAWRVLCCRDFVERLRPRRVSELVTYMGFCTWGVAAAVLNLAGWEYIPPGRSQQRMWAPPINEKFSALDLTPLEQSPDTFLATMERVRCGPGLPAGAEEILGYLEEHAGAVMKHYAQRPAARAGGETRPARPQTAS